VERTVCRSRLPGVLALMLGVALAAIAAPPAGAEEAVTARFRTFDRASRLRVDHGPFDRLLADYVVERSDGSTLVDYAGFKGEGRARLAAYVAALSKVDTDALGRAEQFAFWVNLYNAATLAVVLDHFPVASIRDIDISPGFADGPWGRKVVSVAGVELSLDDIEHRILRPIWRDARIHYAVNCASIGCPNLRRRAFRGAGLDDALDQAARDYVNSPRGVVVEKGAVAASALYRWYARDFGASAKAVLDHIRRYAGPALRARLEGKSYVSGYAYDWRLNGVEAERAE